MVSHNSNVVVPSGPASGLSINLHPLTILNISDHFTRAKYANDGSAPKLLGALLGTQSGRVTSIVNSFELVVVDGSVDEDFFRTRRDQFAQVFPTQSVIGWYTVGSEPSTADFKLHKHISDLVDASPTIFLLYDPNIPDDSKHLPFSVYESALTEATEKEDEKFVPLDFEVEAGEAERIAVDDVANENAGDSDPTGQIASLTRQRNAIAMLLDRVRVVQSYVSGVVNRDSPVDHEILRQCAALAATLPVMDGIDFKHELRTEHNDAQLMTYLTTLLGQLDSVASVSDKHWALHPPQSEDVGIKHTLNPKLGSQAFGPSRRRAPGRR